MGEPSMLEMMKQAREMQKKMAKAQKKVAKAEITATAGGGMVTVVLDGTKRLVSIRLDREVVSEGDIEMLQDLIVAAVNDASRKVDEKLSQSMQGMLGGMKIPGLF